MIEDQLASTGLDSREIWYVADDLGVSESVNRAIAHAHEAGALHGAALMMGQPGTGDAVAYARRRQTLRVGIHFHLNDSVPCTVASWPWGRSPWRAGLSIMLSARARRLVRAELRRQWRAYLGTGLTCEFVSTHHHLHAHPYVHRALMQTIPADFKGWVRLGDVRLFGPTAIDRVRSLPARWALSRRRQACRLRVSDTLWGIDRLCRMDAGEVRRATGTLHDGLHEFIFHPGQDRYDRDTRCLLELR